MISMKPTSAPKSIIARPIQRFLSKTRSRCWERIFICKDIWIRKTRSTGIMTSSVIFVSRRSLPFCRNGSGPGSSSKAVPWRARPLKRMKCRLCQHADLPVVIAWPRFPIYIWPIKKDFDQEYEALNVYHCPRCGLVQLDIFAEDFVRKLYSREVFGLTATSEFPTTLKKNSRFLEYCSRVLGERWNEGKEILDVGGYYVLNAFDLKYRCGVICDPNAPEGHLRENLSICRNFFSRKWFRKGEFDCVVAKHTIEHINDVCAFMDDVLYVLKEGGILVL